MDLDNDDPNIELLKIMKVVDTCHDFYGGKRGADNVNVDEWLNNAIKKLGLRSLVDNSAIADAATLLIQHRLPKPTEARLEPRFAEFLEFKYPNIFVPIEGEYAIIDGDDKGNSDNLKNYMGLTSFRIILKDIDYTTNDLNYIGKFIREFMFGASDDEQNIGFVIDANSGKLPLFFVEDEHVNTYVNALVMADSAGTGENEKNTSNFYNRRTPYVFPASPSDAPPKKFSVKECLMFSTAFIDDIYYEELTANSFAEDFKSFKLVVKYFAGTATIPISAEAYFAPTNKQGPTINTLATLIDKINAYTPQAFNALKNNNNLNNIIYCDNFINYKTGELDIRPILVSMIKNGITQEQLTNFLFDFKRTGDYGQVNSANFMTETNNYVGGAIVKNVAPNVAPNVTQKIIVSTGDELCSMYAKFKKICGVYNHHNNKEGHCIDLYKGKTKTTLTLEEYQEICKKKATYYKNCLNVYAKIETGVLTDEDGVITLLEKESYMLDRIIKEYTDSIQFPTEYPLYSALAQYSKNTYDKERDEMILKQQAPIFALMNAYNEARTIQAPALELANKLKELNVKEKKLTIISGILYKLTEKLANSNNIQGDSLSEKIAPIIMSEMNLNKLNEENIFNYNFGPHGLFLSLYKDLTADATKDADINKKKAEIEKIEDEIDGIKAKLNITIDEREKKKLTNNLNAKEKIVEDKKKPLIMGTSYIGKYKQGLLYQIAVIDDEIIKIIENDNNMKYTRFKVDNNDIYLTGEKIVSNYNVQLTEFLQILQERATARATATARAPTASAPAASAPAASAPPPLMFIGGGKFDEDKKELIFSQKIDNILNSFAGDIKEVLDAIAAPLDNKDKLEGYINALYKLSPKKSENLDCSTKVSVDDYDVMGIKHKGAKVDYNSYMNTTIEQFNIAILKLKEPSLSAKDFYKKIEEHLLKWWELISYNTNTKEIKLYDDLEKINEEISKQLEQLEQKKTLKERDPGDKEAEEGKLNDYNRSKEQIEKEIAKKLYNFLTTYSDYKVKVDEPPEEWKAEKNKEMNNTKKLWGSFAGIVNRVMQSKRFGETWRKRARQGTSVAPSVAPIQRRPSIAPTQRRPATQAPPSRQSKVKELREKQSRARSRKVSSARRLIFDDLGQETSFGGGKRTRKYKNKRNKKTRQRHQKSRKNITIKKRKEKGKHRTPRHK